MADYEELMAMAAANPRELDTIHEGDRVNISLHVFNDSFLPDEIKGKVLAADHVAVKVRKLKARRAIVIPWSAIEMITVVSEAARDF